MGWDAAGAIGEILGAIAVVATLFYLAKQIRQQNRIAEYNVWNSLSQEHKRTSEKFATDPDLFRIYRAGLLDPNGLSESEKTQFSFVMRMLYNDVLKAWKAHRTGLLPLEDWHVQATVFGADLETPGGVEWRSANAKVYPELFEEVDKYRSSGGVLDYQK